MCVLLENGILLSIASIGIMSVTTDNAFTIGRLARAACVNVETIRYYQRKRLLTEPGKPGQGFRIYSQEHLSRVLFIKKAQQLGFTLSEIAQLLSLSDGDCSEVKNLAESKLYVIREKMTDLQRLDVVLTSLIDECNDNADPQCCPIIESLVSDTHKKT